MRQIFLIISIFALFLFLSSCANSSDKIIGKWERIDDDWSGLVIEVKRHGNKLRGEIIQNCTHPLCNRWIIGDVKWKNIKHIKDNEFEFESLAKSAYDDGTITETNYRLYKVELFGDSVLNTQVYAKGNEFIGTKQTYRKVQ